MTDVRWFFRTWSHQAGGDLWSLSWVQELVRRLEADDDPAHWMQSVAELRTELNGVIPSNTVTTSTAAHLHFALDMVDTINPVQEYRYLALGYLVQADVVFPLASLPSAWFDALLRRRQTGVVRAFYELTHKRGSASVLHCVRDSRNITEWHERMALQLVAQAEQELTQVSHMGIALGHGETSDGSGLDARYMPLARLVFSPEELTSLRRQEAYMAEQFAHLYTAVRSESHRQGEPRRPCRAGLCRQQRLPGEAQGSALDARPLHGPPYLIPELDALLKAAQARHET
ncbi:hypothetical protein RB201_00125 [Streptomyces sp. S1A(2023)]